MTCGLIFGVNSRLLSIISLIIDFRSRLFWSDNFTIYPLGNWTCSPGKIGHLPNQSMLFINNYWCASIRIWSMAWRASEADSEWEFHHNDVRPFMHANHFTSHPITAVLLFGANADKSYRSLLKLHVYKTGSGPHVWPSKLKGPM